MIKANYPPTRCEYSSNGPSTCRCMIIEKSKRRDVYIVDVIIPTNLICVFFDPAISTSSFNYIVLYTFILIV